MRLRALNTELTASSNPSAVSMLTRTASCALVCLYVNTYVHTPKYTFLCICILGTGWESVIDTHTDTHNHSTYELFQHWSTVTLGSVHAVGTISVRVPAAEQRPDIQHFFALLPHLVEVTMFLGSIQTMYRSSTFNPSSDYRRPRKQEKPCMLNESGEPGDFHQAIIEDLGTRRNHSCIDHRHSI